MLQLYLLRKNLKVSSNDRSLSVTLLGSGLSQAFLNAMVCLLGKPNVLIALFVEYCVSIPLIMSNWVHSMGP